MLAKFEVENFKNFNNRFVFDFSDTRNYEFNAGCVKNNIVNKCLVYGHNGSGKSNLGFAIFDLVSHLTDKNASSSEYTNFLNANNRSKLALFKYVFKFECGDVEYSYSKSDKETLVAEELLINGNLFARIDRNLSTIAEFDIEGAENLATEIGDSQISIVSYIKKNTVLERNIINQCFYRFIEFINGMLFFRSLEKNNYIGFEQGSRHILADIVEKNNVEDFEKFLNDVGVKCQLSIFDDTGRKGLAFSFGDKQIPFFNIASQGTVSLALFYYWMQRIRGEESKVTFLFIDEFDAFYHHSLSEAIIKQLMRINAQTVITSHNTSVMTNELLRPDCYFLLKENGIESLSSSTPKELREAHNIEKMYRAGSFNG
ncbi:AAA family ATPase [Shewanella oncorhynchi]|uniref:AAA family ATPase n=1 Tax=Shewanella oncorhynchi TaxID=2726434 RepID=UPI003D7AD93A